jgi:hypothetical protein
MRELGAPSPNTQFSTLFFVIMSKQVLISLLSKGNTGNEILSILDALTNEAVSDNEQANVPTLDVIEF